MKTFFFLGVKTCACGMRKESCWIKLAGALSTVRENVALTMRTLNNKQVRNIEEITWLHRDTNFIFKCCDYLSLIFFAHS